MIWGTYVFYATTILFADDHNLSESVNDLNNMQDESISALSIIYRWFKITFL